MADYKSWGNHFDYEHKVRRLNWRSEDLSFLGALSEPVLPYGFGHSYGDVCLNDGGWLIDAGHMNRFISFDDERGVVRCEAGVSLAEILELVMPRGWFLRVLPGTKYVTVGGAIANDVHGKNHHIAGTFGSHVSKFELVRSDGSRTICSPTENVELFSATIGGMGLTGLITWAEIELKRIRTGLIDAEYVKFKNIGDFFELNETSEKSHDYTVAWVDCLATGGELGRGIYMRGNHIDEHPRGPRSLNPGNLDPRISVPIYFPGFALNKWSIKLFNMFYNSKQRVDIERRIVGFNSFFTPLDSIGEWNRIYGKRGFFQYQFVLPGRNESIVRKIFEKIAVSGMASFLVVLKSFGGLESPGLMTFPKDGVTLALDFPNRGDATMKFMKELNGIVFENGGRLNPSKDSVMDIDFYRASFPNIDKFEKQRDMAFSSSFWRRVTGQ